MSEYALTPAERALLTALDRLGTRYLLVGMGAALVEGAQGTTQDLDLWLERVVEAELRDAARAAGGFYTSGLGVQPPSLGGEGLDRIDLVLSAHGLESFDREYARAKRYEIDGVTVSVLPLERVIASKRAANRPKDLAQIDAPEAARGTIRGVLTISAGGAIPYTEELRDRRGHGKELRPGSSPGGAGDGRTRPCAR
ncbi:MAG: hypothetical protein U0166_10660 [Acidobacteriota bacterium]